MEVALAVSIFLVVCVIVLRFRENTHVIKEDIAPEDLCRRDVPVFPAESIPLAEVEDLDSKSYPVLKDLSEEDLRLIKEWEKNSEEV